jgi:Rha family phage regulatory protein
MKELIVKLEVKKNQVVTDSLIVARDFSKQHKDVLRAIDTIKTQIQPAQFCARYFETMYKDEKGEMRRKYLVNFDGFSLLVMGFNGKKAMKWKLAYQAEFNRMKQIIKERETIDWKNTRTNGKIERKDFTDLLQQLVGYAQAQNYKGAKWTFSQYTKLINKALGIKQGKNTRDCCTTKQLNMINQLEESLTHVINDGMQHNAPAGAIYKKCKQYCDHYLNMLFIDSPFKPAELR